MNGHRRKVLEKAQKAICGRAQKEVFGRAQHVRQGTHAGRQPLAETEAGWTPSALALLLAGCSQSPSQGQSPLKALWTALPEHPMSLQQQAMQGSVSDWGPVAQPGTNDDMCHVAQMQYSVHAPRPPCNTVEVWLS